MNVVSKSDRNIIRKIALTVFGGVIWAMLCPANAACSPSSTISSSTPLSISDGFNTTAEYDTTLNTNWSGHLTCTAGSVFGTTLYYQSALDGGYPVNFIDTSKGLDQVITFYAVPDSTSEWYWLIGENNIGNTSYTLTAKLGNTSSNSVSEITSSGSVSLVTIAFTDSSSYTAEWIRSNYTTNSAVKAYALVNVTFDPDATTCSISDQSFTLPSVTLAALRAGDNVDTNFNLNIACQGALNSKVTRSADVRLYSNDLVDSNNYIIRNSSSTSSGIGFQLFSNAADPVVFSSSPDSGSTSLWAMTKGSDLQGSDNFTLGARYKIYAPSSTSGGSVVGTVIAYIDYD